VWVQTHKLELHSLLIEDVMGETWTKTVLNSPIKFIRELDYNGHNIFVVTEEEEVYLAKSANRSVNLLFSLKESITGRIIDGSYDIEKNSFNLLIKKDNKRTNILKLWLRDQLVADTEEVSPKYQVLLTIDGKGIVRIEQNERNGYKLISAEGNEYLLSSGKERMTESGLIFPTEPFIRIEKGQELPETPVEIQAINTADVFRAIDRAEGAEYDIDTQHDIRSEFEDSNQFVPSET
jgi:hypothetical protein